MATTVAWLLLLAACAQEAPHASGAALSTPVADEIRAIFPRTRGWFRIVSGLGWVQDGSDGLTPDYATLTHPRVRRADGAGRRLAPRLASHFAGVLRLAAESAAAAAEDARVEVALTPVGAQDVAAILEDGLVVYRGAYQDTDVLYKATPTHLDEYLLLRTREAPTRWRYRVASASEDVTLRQAGNSIEVVDRQGASWLRASPPVAVDRSGARVEGTIVLQGDEIVIELDLRALQPPILVDPDWMSTGDMAYGRFYHQLTPLADGRFLATGGCSAAVCSGDLSISCRTVVRTAERLDLGTRTFSRGGDDTDPRFFHVAARLEDGTVLVAGGCAASDCSTTLSSASLFHPTDLTFEAVGSLAEARAGMVVAPLPGGRILIAGGCTSGSCTTRTEAYDPGARAFTTIAPLHVARGRATASVLPDGRVLVAGGCSDIACANVVAAAELYDPALDRWISLPSLGAPRAGHYAAALLDGRVLVGGGCSTQTCAPVLRSAEVFDPARMVFDAVSDMGAARFGAVALLLPDGNVMISQGCEGRGVCDLTNELWEPGVGAFRPMESAVTSRAFHATVLSYDAAIVVANGGCQPETCSWWNETYDVSGLVRPDAAVSPDDAGPRDAAVVVVVDAGQDASQRRDAGPRPARYTEGCACRLAPRASGTHGATAVSLVLVTLVGVRRRRRTGRASGAAP